MNSKRLSKFLSLILRHQPEVAKLTLDGRGFCHIDKLIKAASAHLHETVTREDLEELCTPSDNPQEKTRFELEGDYIRAGHGHSIAISGYPECVPTQALFHATPRAAVAAIQKSGLSLMSRQKVHLSYDRAITLEAARRRNRDVVLIEVLWEEAIQAGIKFYSSADSRIILSDDLPTKYLKIDLSHQK